jgi:hypothetical protein
MLAQVLMAEVGIRTLRLLQRCDVLYVLGWQALHKLIHFELVCHTRLLAFPSSRYKIASVGVEQASEASHERRAHLIRSESRWADDADRIDASTMGVCATTYTMLEKQSTQSRSSTHRYNDTAHRRTSLRISSIGLYPRVVSTASNDLLAIALSRCCVLGAWPCQA